MITHLPGPAYRITTSRLIVRCYQPADAALVKAAIDENIEHLRPWMPWISAEPQTIQQKIDLMRRFRGAFDQDVDYVYGIFDQQETRQLGSTGLHPRLGPGAREIGYWIHKDFTRQGLATETSAALTRVAFEIDGVSRVEIHCDDQNIASAAVPRKLGYTLETILSEPDPCNEGRLRQTMIWVLYRDHYPLTPSAQASLQAFDAGGRRIL